MFQRHNECSAARYVADLVAQQARERPEAIAISVDDRRLTYRDLDVQASVLAHELCVRGVGPDTPVALCLPRSIAMVTAALSILKAGGAYVALDPEYPAERLSFILKNVQPRVVLTSAYLSASLREDVKHTITVDENGRMASAQPSQFSPTLPTVSGQNLAYIIYTSGSTGTPKGVEITHGGLLNLTRWHQEVFRVTAADRASQVAGIGFDAAVWELWPYLAAGANVHLAADDIRTDAVALRDWLISSAITIAFIPTPMAERMMLLEWPSKTALRAMLTGGDVLHMQPPANLPFALVNNYGPTECTVVTTSGIVLEDRSAVIPPTIGKPVANTTIHILDENLQPVPVGTAGEICIGGAGVARGYVNRPDLTSERFIPDPFTGTPGARLYRTGDLGSYEADGQVAFLGRTDDQLKIRGYRIEPNEIVCQLNQSPYVLQSAVCARETGSGEKQLVAYCVLQDDTRSFDSELRTFLRARLPEFMIPAIFVQTTSLPLTANGKVDRARLPTPTRDNIISDDSVETPRSPVEDRLASVLQSLLAVEQIRGDENFFQLGGHSMLGAQVVARVREIFGVELSLRRLFEGPTLSGMSAEIERLILEKLGSAGETGVELISLCEKAAL